VREWTSTVSAASRSREKGGPAFGSSSMEGVRVRRRGREGRGKVRVEVGGRSSEEEGEREGTREGSEPWSSSLSLAEENGELRVRQRVREKIDSLESRRASP